MTRKLLALLVIVVWGACFPLIKAGLSEAPPLFYAALRGLVAALPLLVVSVALGRLIPPRAVWGWLALLGAGSVALGAMYLSAGLAGAAIPSVLANIQALIVAPFAVWLFGESLSWGKLVGLFLGFGGASVTVASKSDTLGGLEGSILAVLASFGIASGTLILKKIGPRVDFVTATAWQYLIGSALLLAASLGVEEVQRTTWSPGFISGLLFLGLAGSAATSLVWFQLVQREELIELSALTFLTPVVGLLLSVALFGESLGLISLVGLALTIAGVAWVLRPTTEISTWRCCAAPASVRGK